MTGGDAFEAILLAAGSGTRFGGGKLLAPWRDGVLIEGALAAAFAAPVARVVVVTGADDEAVGRAVQAYANRTGQAARLRVVHAPDHAEGMGASLRTAAAALSPDARGVFVFLGDMPRIPPAIAEALIQAVRDGAPAAAPVFQGERGHPALIGRDLIPQLLILKGDAGARAVLKDLGDRLARVEAPDDGVLFDVDERGDLDGGAKR
ncbi:nucleotidyltransferase family protein [Phenylobacterium aquaticum]|uniref:nucleotidyltransferase family protein n=1 Tax=Phenylobacterium aquaticum TaxID=1763816 RepID=UPI001F5CC33E|nr:nucleotidyltransferase family protein [Phenylobacterium aquaticum]MCI3133285.1 nucleotidyltransferase family protein [Phenylobacterium aquaticum]